jgi:hypothetical protein
MNASKSKPNGSGPSAHANQQPARRLSRTKSAGLPDTNESSAERITRLLNRAQVAQRLGTCRATVQRLTRKGLLPAIVFNRRLIRYAPEVVEAYIRAAMTGMEAVRQ